MFSLIYFKLRRLTTLTRL